MTSGGKKDPTYVEDVFSTYVYKGNNSSNRIITNGIKLGNANAGSSVDFSDYGSLVVPESADFKFGTGAFTIEFYIYFISSTNYISIFDGRPLNTNGNQTTMNMYANGQLNWYDLTNNTAVISPAGATQLNVNQWTHVAYVREGTGTNQAKMYFNGSLVGTGTDPQDYAVNQLNRIGGQPWSPGVSKFSISNYRVVKGTAVYTSNFTTPTAPLTDISGTVLLCCQSSTDPFAAAVTPGPITIGTQSQATTPFAQSFGTETATDGEGGLVWTKSRTSTAYHVLQDTDGTTSGKFLQSQSSDAAISSTTTLHTFNNSGYTLGNDAAVNNSSHQYSSWTFRKAPGFFDVVTWTGTDGSTDRVLSHSLKSIPGCVIIKCTSDASSWAVYHKSLGLDAFKGLLLEQNSTGQQLNKTVAISNTTFTARSSSNDLNKTYVAYLFAGGASTAATAPSVSFNGSNYLQVPSSSDFAYGTGDFTWECWAKSPNNPAERILISNGTDYGYIGIYSQNGMTSVQYVGKGTSPHLQSDGFSVARNQWFHVAISRNSGVSRLFLNGQLCNTPASDTNDYPAGVVDIGRSSTSPNNPWQGWISNVRIVKGTGLYTSSFTPSTEPLKNVSGTVLLCCNDSSPTGSTVTPGTITNNGATASTDTPFDDPAGYKFGEEGDQNIIKCGKITTDTTNGSTLDLPWEPQWILFKRTDATSNWTILDCIRGWTDYGTDWMLYPNRDWVEGQGSGYEEILRNAIRFQGYGNNYDFVYMAIRRPEPLVSKPVEVGSNVFAMDTGNASTTTPVFDSGFPVDFAMNRNPASATSWYTSARSMQDRYLLTNDQNTENTDTGARFDSNLGWAKDAYNTWNTNYQSWMWKRHAGFDVVPYFGNGQSNRQVKHNLARSPEMIWIKRRDQNGNAGDWMVGHKDLYGGSSPWNGYLVLNKSQGQYNDHHPFSNYTPTAVNFEVSNWDRVNNSGSEYISFLFASIEGISKVGSYAGSNSAQTITTGFQPRFLIIKNLNDSRNWQTLDTTRGWGAGNDCRLFLDLSESQICTSDVGAPTSTGFSLTTGNQRWNISGDNYIYYAHA